MSKSGQSSSRQQPYHIVVFEAPEDPPAMRDLLCRVTGAHPTDAMQWVARTPGIWRRPLPEDQVRPLLDGLYELGVPAEAHRVDRLPNLAPARTIHGASCLEEGLRITGLRGEPTHWVPWDKVELIAAGLIPQEDEYRDVVPPGWVRAVRTGLNAALRRPQAVARRQRAMRISREPVREAILVREDPRIAFRVVETEMSYAYLGDRLQPAASANFPLFLGDVCRLASNATIAPSTQALLDGGDPDTYTFESSQALLDYANLRLLWSWYRRDRDAANPDQDLWQTEG
jgi:hypothetical protein